MGVIEAKTATCPNDLEGLISILGEKGAVEICGFAVKEIKVWQFRDSRPEDIDTVSRFKENPQNVYWFGHVRYLQYEKSYVDGMEGKNLCSSLLPFINQLKQGK